MRQLLICSILIGSFLCGLSGHAQIMGQSVKQKDGFSGHPLAIKILHDLEKTFDAQDPVYMDVVSTRTAIDAKGVASESTEIGRIWMRKPGKVLWVSQGKTDWDLVSDGKNMYLYLPERQVYTLRSMDQAKLDSELLPLSVNYGLILAHLVCPSLRGKQPVTFNLGEDLKQEIIDGVSLHHFRMTVGRNQLNLWLNDKQLPVRIVEGMIFPDNTITNTLVEIDWITGKTIPDNAFVVTPHVSARKVEALLGVSNAESSAGVTQKKQ